MNEPTQAPKPVDADEVKRLRLKKGDILVVSMPELLTQAQADHVKTSVRFVLQQAGLHHVPVLVLQNGASIEVVDAAAALKEAANARQATLLEAPPPAERKPSTASAIRAELERREAADQARAAITEAPAVDGDEAAFA